MNITRHNYEEFFILYMDNELSSDDRRMVEAFVQQHTDLKEELDSLLQYKLEPDTEIVFTGKEELLKLNGETPVSLANYEEWLLLYIDNELSAPQRKAVEQLAAANPAIQQELELIEKSKLQPATIVFPYKESLYRREEEKRRAVPLRWWRAAAAILLLAIGLTVVIITGNRSASEKGEVAIKEIKPQQNNTATENAIGIPDVSQNPVATVTETESPVIKTPIENTVQKNQPAPGQYKQTNNPVAVSTNKEKDIKNTPVNIAPLRNDMPVVADNTIKPSNNLPQPEDNPNFKKDAANMGMANVNDAVKQALTDNNVTSKAAQPSNIIQAAVTDDADFAVTGGNKKNKLRGFFRKVTRTFEKRTNIDPTDGEDRLLVAGLAFKTK
jgi:hypothetical protein